MPEVLAATAVLGIVLAIATSTWFDLVEGRRVTSATNQLGSDMRLAHTKSVNRLETWRVVLVPGRGAESFGPDYYLVRLDSSGNVVSNSAIRRTLPETTTVVANPLLNDDGAVSLLYALLPNAPSQTRTLEFKSDGSMRALATGVGADTVRVTEDGNPEGQITFIAATSRIRIVA